MTIHKRIRELRGPESRKSFAERFGISLNTVVRYENGDNLPDAGFISEICKYYKVSADFLVFGADKHITSDGEVVVNGQQYVNLPISSISYSSDEDKIRVDDEFPTHRLFLKEWLDKRGAPQDLLLVRAKSSTLYPTIKEGNVVLLNTGNFSHLSGKVYAVASLHTVEFYRVVFEPTRILLCGDWSQDKRYETRQIVVHLEEVMDEKFRFKVLARAVWWEHSECTRYGF